jgi:predicted ATPase
MKTCECAEVHAPKRIVLTGGPGAGKTAVLELIRHSFCKHVVVLPESAGIIFGGGFPRGERVELRRAGQRAIFYIQRELEQAGEADHPAIILCDRGTVDGGAYWPGPDDYFIAVGTTLQEQLARYEAVIHLRTPSLATGYNRQNPLRIESAAEAEAIDQRILALWAGHPKLSIVEPAESFLAKASQALELLRRELPECCRGHRISELEGGRS